MTVDNYRWGDVEIVTDNKFSIRPDIVKFTRSFSNDHGDIVAVAGSIPYAPGTHEVFLFQRKITFSLFKRLREELENHIASNGLNSVLAYIKIDDSMERNVKFARRFGFKIVGFLPKYWDGEDFVLLVRV